ncbi:MAG: type II toxin-antitoxin system RelE/ParE family toxin [Legionella sp.]|nr:type II toxin-antitoxin system RelE/ParE family toxin [Legionella sp.]
MIMNLKVKQTNLFKKSIKKLPKQKKSHLDEEIKKLIKNPNLGAQKKGDLDFLRVHKFNLSNQQYLLGYTYDESELVLALLKLGTHENFYRDIKR